MSKQLSKSGSIAPQYYSYPLFIKLLELSVPKIPKYEGDNIEEFTKHLDAKRANREEEQELTRQRLEMVIQDYSEALKEVAECDIKLI